MIISKTTGYAIQVLIYLANTKDQELISVNELHRKFDISFKYLGRLMTKLLNVGLVESERGKYGGYRLIDKQKPIYLMDIIKIIDGIDNFNACLLGSSPCEGNEQCTLHQHWYKPKMAMEKMLTTVKIQDFLKDPKFLQEFEQDERETLT